MRRCIIVAFLMSVLSAGDRSARGAITVSIADNVGNPGSVTGVSPGATLTVLINVVSTDSVMPCPQKAGDPPAQGILLIDGHLAASASNIFTMTARTFGTGWDQDGFVTYPESKTLPVGLNPDTEVASGRIDQVSGSFTFATITLQVDAAALAGQYTLRYKNPLTANDCFDDVFASEGVAYQITIGTVGTGGGGGGGGGGSPPTDLCLDDPLKTEPGICGCGVPDTDTDGDGVPDCNDGCPMDARKTALGICGCGTADVDVNTNGIVDCLEGCPGDPNKPNGPGQCGCGKPDTDRDGDGVADCNDGCPDDPAKVTPGLCGCGRGPDVDSDADGVPDCKDVCPGTSAGQAVDSNGCAVVMPIPTPTPTPVDDGSSSGNPQGAVSAPASGCGVGATGTVVSSLVGLFFMPRGRRRWR